MASIGCAGATCDLSAAGRCKRAAAAPGRPASWPVLAAALLMLLSACATGPRPALPRATGSDATPAVTAPRPGPPDAGDAVDGLLAAARKLRAAGDLAACFARLERALRIAPQRAEVYLELARAHLAAGAPERAAGAAQRGLAFCQGRVCRELRAVTEA